MSEVESGHGESRQTPRTHEQDQQVGEMEALAAGNQNRVEVREMWEERVRERRTPGSQGRESEQFVGIEPEDAMPQLSHEQGPEVGRDIEPCGGVLFIPGQPVPAPRIKVGRWGAYYGKQYGAWLPAAREYVESAWDGGCYPAGVALAVRLEFRVQRPKSHYRTGRNSMKLKERERDEHPFPNGDVDNFAKGPLDALAGTAYADDKQIIRLGVTKFWTTVRDEVPGVRCEVEIA